jgi:hypothetical protein
MWGWKTAPKKADKCGGKQGNDAKPVSRMEATKVLFPM